MPINNFRTPDGDIENESFITESWLVDQWIGDQLWSWGSNAYGQLGINNITYRSTPVTTVPGGSNWKQVSAGYEHIAAIKTDGTLWAWGRNNYGHLGDGTTVNRSTPVQISVLTFNWKQVSAGKQHTAAIKTDGSLWVWGRNVEGQLGTNNSLNISTPITTFAGGSNWKQVSCGNQFTAAIKTDGSLWLWGTNDYGQLGVNFQATNISTPVTTFTGGNNWKQVSCGTRHILATKTDGSLWSWGANDYGQLGVNFGSAARSTPVTTLAGGNNWKQVSAGGIHNAAIKFDGSLWTWGNAGAGRLGNNTNVNASSPVTTFAGGNNWKFVNCGSNTTAAIKMDGSLWVWGGHVGDNISISRSTPVTTFAGGNNWRQVSVGGDFASSITSGPEY